MLPKLTKAQSLLLILGLCLLVTAFFIDIALAVDPDMQALVIDNGSGLNPTPVPEPVTGILMATGLGGLALSRWRRKK